MPYVYLALAIVAEVVATTALKASRSFTQVTPSIVVVVGYAFAFFFLARCVQHINIGVVYAIWSGVGIVLITLLGFVLYREKLDLAGVVGMALILAGVVVLNLYSAAAKVH
jgi:small multidrug resistance pump